MDKTPAINQFAINCFKKIALGGFATLGNT